MDARVGSHLFTPVTMAPAAPAMVRDFPEVVNAARITRPRRLSVQYREKKFQEELVGFADNSLFGIFTFPFISGDPKTALQDPFTVVITKDMAKKYFADEDPLGKMLKINGETEYAVTGVVENVPRNSHFRFHMLRSFETLYTENRPGLEHWLNVGYYTYLLLEENCDYKELEQKFPALVEEHLGPTLKAIGGALRLFLQPLTGIHLYSNFERDLSGNGNITYVYLFSGIALFVILIACINFINLATARSMTRALEVGIRKTFGAVKGKLIRQFLGESLIYSFIALILSIVLLELALPLFNAIVGRELSLPYLQLPWLIPGFVGFAILAGLVAGSYPAFFLSSFKPVRVLKGDVKAGASNSRFRSVLVVSQFAISIALIICTITIYFQINYMKNKKLGFDKEHVIVLPGMNDAMRRSYPSIKNELMNIPGVTGVGVSSIVPGRGRLVGIFLPEGFSEDQQQTLDYLNIDPGYISTMGMEIAAGRNFSADLATDSSESVIINQTAAGKLGWKEPLGKTFIFKPSPGEEGETTIMTVIGVVKDFHMASLRQKIEPQIIFYDLSSVRNISIRIASDDIMHTVGLLRKKWKEIDPQRPFDYFFLDEVFDSQYRAEERAGNLTLYFSLLAIFIGCLGLFGLAAFMAEKRTKNEPKKSVSGKCLALPHRGSLCCFPENF
jgi:putative ABC transport system permease protein